MRVRGQSFVEETRDELYQMRQLRTSARPCDIVSRWRYCRGSACARDTFPPAISQNSGALHYHDPVLFACSLCIALNIVRSSGPGRAESLRLSGQLQQQITVVAHACTKRCKPARALRQVSVRALRGLFVCDRISFNFSSEANQWFCSKDCMTGIGNRRSHRPP